MSDFRSTYGHGPRIGMIVNGRLTYRTMADACQLHATAGAEIDGRVMETDFGVRDITGAERAQIEASVQAQVSTK